MPVDYTRLAEEVKTTGRQALDLLAAGLGTYGAAPALHPDEQVGPSPPHRG